MKEYEVMIESINPCGGARHAIKEFVDVETDSPEAYVRSNSPFPVMEITANADGDTVIITGNDAGYRKKYTFS
ncbi:MAG: hypothetical protein MJ099_00055 [Clostridia bacterium]|nr:hypothetical protein [Clostridia bacterium]